MIFYLVPHWGFEKKFAIRKQGPDPFTPKPKSDSKSDQYRPSTAYHRRQMPDGKAPKVEVREHVPNPPKRRNGHQGSKRRLGKSWKNRKGDWRHRPRSCNCQRCQIGQTRDLRREYERTAHAMQEWKSDIEPVEVVVDPWEAVERHNEYMLDTATRALHWMETAGYLDEFGWDI